MISHTTKRFRQAFRRLPAEIKAREAFGFWKQDARNPRRQFKQVLPDQPVYSVRIGLGWRALGILTGNVVVWFWIGSHADYDHLISQIRRS